MKKYSPEEIEALINHDGLLCKPPWKHPVHKRQYYARHIERYLWRSFSPEDWRNVAEIIDDLRIDPKLKHTTKFLLPRHV